MMVTTTRCFQFGTQKISGRWIFVRLSVPIVQETGCDPGLVLMGVKIPPPPGFDPSAIQPVASCYTGYAAMAHDTQYCCQENATERVEVFDVSDPTCTPVTGGTTSGHFLAQNVQYS